MQELFNEFVEKGYVLSKAFQYGKYYVNAKATSKANYIRGDGKKLIMYPSWYSMYGVSQPTTDSRYSGEHMK